MGWRGWSGRRSGPWPGRGPFSYLPPWQRPGWLFGYGRGVGYRYGGVGYGRGLGYGRGIGYGYMGAPYNPYVCQRSPWLSRWWWANPTYGYTVPYRSAYPGFGGYPTPGYPWAYPSYVPSPTPMIREQEIEALTPQIQQLESQLREVKKRLEELKR